MDKYTVLVIEDDSHFAELLKVQLQERGFEVVVASDGRSGVDEIAHLIPSLVLLDIILPEVDGYQVLEMIRNNANDRIAKIPVIIVSNLGQPEEISRAIQFGISDYVVKSTSNPGLIADKVAKKLIGATPVKSPDLPHGATKTAKLLIVEDDKFLRDLEVQKLQKESNIQVFAAMDGEQGVMIAEKEIPDIILLDILLPGIDGFEVLTRLRANTALVQTKVIMLSNFGQKEDIERAQKLGALKFLIKANFTLDEIVEEVKAVL